MFISLACDNYETQKKVTCHALYDNKMLMLLGLSNYYSTPDWDC